MFDLTRVKWTKSTYSGINGCIEVAFSDRQVAIRDSKDPQGPVLFFNAVEWHAFVDGVQDGQFDPYR